MTAPPPDQWLEGLGRKITSHLKGLKGEQCPQGTAESKRGTQAAHRRGTGFGEAADSWP